MTIKKINASTRTCIDRAAKSMKNCEIIAESKEDLLSVKFLQQFISLSGKREIMSKAMTLLNAIRGSVLSGRLPFVDIYFHQIRETFWFLSDLCYGEEQIDGSMPQHIGKMRYVPNSELHRRGIFPSDLVETLKSLNNDPRYDRNDPSFEEFTKQRKLIALNEFHLLRNELMDESFEDWFSEQPIAKSAWVVSFGMFNKETFPVEPFQLGQDLCDLTQNNDLESLYWDESELTNCGEKEEFESIFAAYVWQHSFLTYRQDLYKIVKHQLASNFFSNKALFKDFINRIAIQRMLPEAIQEELLRYLETVPEAAPKRSSTKSLDVIEVDDEVPLPPVRISALGIRALLLGNQATTNAEAWAAIGHTLARIPQKERATGGQFGKCFTSERPKSQLSSDKDYLRPIFRRAGIEALLDNPAL